jgi:hypothetical protein
MEFKIFPSFFDHPARIRFEHQEDDEVIDLFLRQHWVTNVPWIIIATIGIFLPYLIIGIDLANFFQLEILSRLPYQILVGVVILWYMLVTFYIIENFLHWYFNIYIVTNRHLVDINFTSLLQREKLEAGLENVESASSKISGIIRSLFNYGDVIVQTAAESQQITFLKVPFPDRVADRINDLRQLAGGRSHAR